MKKIMMLVIVIGLVLLSVACSKKTNEKEEIKTLSDVLPKNEEIVNHFNSFNESLSHLKPESKENIHLLSGKELPFLANKNEVFQFTYGEKQEHVQFSYYQTLQGGEYGPNFYIIDVYSMKENPIVSSGLHKKLASQSSNSNVKVDQFDNDVYFYHIIKTPTSHSVYTKNNEHSIVKTTANEIYVYNKEHLYRISYLVPSGEEVKTQEFMEGLTYEMLFGVGM